MKRRSFLTTATALALAQFLVGCDRSADLKVELLKNTIPAQMLGKFRDRLAVRAAINFSAKPQLQDLFDLLQEWRRKSEMSEEMQPGAIANLVTLGDYWLATAIKQKLIQPLDTDSLSEWEKLPEKWQNLVRRNGDGDIDPQGVIWGAPYQWGTTLIVYRVDRFKSLGWTPTDWKDLWREELRDRISLLDQPREVIGLVLKKLGHSYNSENLGNIPNLKSELIELNKQVKFYSSNTYLQPLIFGDTWLAVGWSNEVLPLLKNRRDIAAIIPQSGTTLSANLWVKPVMASQSDLADRWINFCWQPDIAQQLSLMTRSTSPILSNTNRSNLDEKLRDDLLLLPPKDVMEKSEFLLPLSEGAIAQYRQLWKEIRI